MKRVNPIGCEAELYRLFHGSSEARFVLPKNTNRDPHVPRKMPVKVRPEKGRHE